MNDLFSKIQIIIVTFNSSKTILNCLRSINRNFDTTVIDNCSVDGAVDLIRKNFSQVKIIRNNLNYGFGTANNIGIRTAKKNYVFLLNPDTELLDESIQKALAYMEKNEDVGILGPKLIDKGGFIQKEIRRSPNILSEILILLKVHRLPVLKNLVYPSLDYTKTQEVDHLMGAALFIRKAVFDKIGLFDENFFLWFEETDFEKRAKESGFKIMYYPEAEVEHLTSHSIKQIDPVSRQKIWNGSLRYYFKKHHSILERIVLEPFIALSYLPAFMLSLVRKLNRLWI